MRTVSEPFASYPATTKGKLMAKDQARAIAKSPCWEGVINKYDSPWILVIEDFLSEKFHVVVSYKP